MRMLWSNRRRPRLARQRQVQRDRLGEADRGDGVDQGLAGGAFGHDAREERPARDAAARRRLERCRLDAGARVDALVERQREAVRDEAGRVQALVDRHAALEQRLMPCAL